MQDWLAATAHARPDAIALVADGRTWTYRALSEQVAKLCSRLMKIGMQPDDRVGVLLPNCAEYVWLIHALARLEMILVPLNARLTSEELAYQVSKAACSYVIYGPDATTKISSLSAHTIALEALVADLEAVTAQPDLLNGQIDLDEVQSIVFTSGTSGKPKGARLTFGNFFYGATASGWRLGTLPDDRWLACMPLYHVGGLSIVWRCCLYGTALVLEPGFNVERVRTALQTEKITLISLVPTMLYRLLEAGVNFPSSLRLVLLGGAAATPELIARCIKAKIPIATTYGLTETASQVATMLPDDVRRKPGSVGKPLMFTQILIGTDGREPASPGELGEVIVIGPTIMRGYLDNEGDALHEDGLYTGDMGYLDSDGDLWIVQRRSDLIVSGGENVYPAEVEATLRQHPVIAEACVVGVSDAEWGQVVAAMVVLRPGMALTTSEIEAFCVERLAGYKRPRRFAFVEALPQTASGKIDRHTVVKHLALTPSSSTARGRGGE